MPRFDGTGPESDGPFTGWGDGDCTDEKVENEVQSVNTTVRRRPIRRRLMLSRWRNARFGGRGQGVKRPGRGRHGRR